MDVLLYAFVLDHVRAEFGIDDSMSGLLLALPLLASAAGGVLFGWLADRFGRTRALMASILVYSVATAACGLVGSVWQLAAARLLVGLGMGGEWATGAALVAETWPAEHRGKALGLMQSAWAVGYASAAALNARGAADVWLACGVSGGPPAGARSRCGFAVRLRSRPCGWPALAQPSRPRWPTCSPGAAPGSPGRSWR